jgi:hypothetical protein
MGSKRTVAGVASALLLVAIGAGGGSAFAGGGGSAGPKPQSPPAPVVGADGKAAPSKDGALNLASNASTEFHPVTACRIVSTKGHGGAFGATTTRSYFVVANLSFKPQGGHAGGCGIPVGATQIVARLTAANPTKSGTFTAYPTGASVALGTLPYTAGRSAATEATLNLASGAGKVLTVSNRGGVSNLTVDVVGYYRPVMEGLIYTGSTATPTSDGYVYSGSPAILSVTWVSLGIADVTMDRDVTFCTPTATAYYGDFYYANAKAFNGNQIRVYSWSIDPTTHDTAFVNNYVYLTVTC